MHLESLCTSNEEMTKGGTTNQSMMKLRSFSLVEMMVHHQQIGILSYIHPRNEPPQNVSHMSANADSMVYPVIFPRGELGWWARLRHNEAKQLQNETL